MSAHGIAMPEPLLINGALAHGTFETGVKHEEIDFGGVPCGSVAVERWIDLQVRIYEGAAVRFRRRAEKDVPLEITIQQPLMTLEQHRQAVADAQAALDKFVDSELAKITRQRDERLPKICDFEDAIGAAASILQPYAESAAIYADGYHDRKLSKAHKHLTDIRDSLQEDDYSEDYSA